MRIIESIAQMQEFSARLKDQGKMIGFVPTMGYLHEGHLSLIRKANSECDIVIVSIFINPTQFGPKEDLRKYPKDLARDRRMLKSAGVDVLFCPTAKDMYPEGYGTYIYVGELTDKMCGRSRPGHFRGVATIVAKLFNIIRPDIAYFGKKDYQQQVIIKRMVSNLNMDIRVSALPIVREEDGLAMSSRNVYLDNEERLKAVLLSRSLLLAKEMVKAGVNDARRLREAMIELLKTRQGIKIDYIAIVDPNDLTDIKSIKNNAVIAIAAHVGRTRLIDNIEI